MKLQDCNLFYLRFDNETFGVDEEGGLFYQNITDLLMDFHVYKMSPIKASYELAKQWYSDKSVIIMGYRSTTLDKDMLLEHFRNALTTKLVTAPTQTTKNQQAITDFLAYVSDGLYLLDSGAFTDGYGISYHLNGDAIGEILNG